MMTERGKHALRTSRNGDLRLRLGNFFQRAFLTLLISLLLVHSSLLNLFMNLSFDLISLPSLASLSLSQPLIVYCIPLLHQFVLLPLC